MTRSRMSQRAFFDPSKEMVVATSSVLPVYDGSNLVKVKPASTKIMFWSQNGTNVTWNSGGTKATFTHTLNCVPNVIVMNDSGEQVYGTVVVVSSTSFSVDFDYAVQISEERPWTCAITYAAEYGDQMEIEDGIATSLIQAQSAASAAQEAETRVSSMKEAIESSYQSVLMGPCKDMSIIFGSPVCLSWTDPDDYELNGTKFATWWKTELWRYPSDSQWPEYPGYPGAELIVTTEVGGEHVKNEFQTTPFYDNTAISGLTYTYALFSYTTSGAYNQLSANRFPVANTWSADTLHMFSQNGTITNYLTPGQLFTMNHSDFTAANGTHDIPVRFMGYDCVEAWDTALYPHCAVFQTVDCLYGAETLYAASPFDPAEAQYALTHDTAAVAGKAYYINTAGTTYVALSEGVDYAAGDTSATVDGVTYNIWTGWYEKNPNPNYGNGNNNYSIAQVRKYLNSDGAVGTWNSPNNIFETTQAYANRKGFLYGLEASIKRNLIPVRRKIALANPYGGGSYEVQDRIFLPTIYEVFGNKNNNIAEGLRQWDWYAGWYGDEAEIYSNNLQNKRIKTLNGNAGNIWWCASPHTGGGNHVYNTTATGTQHFNYAGNSYGLAVAYAL